MRHVDIPPAGTVLGERRPAAHPESVCCFIGFSGVNLFYFPELHSVTLHQCVPVADCLLLHSGVVAAQVVFHIYAMRYFLTGWCRPGWDKMLRFALKPLVTATSRSDLVARTFRH